MKKLTSVRCVLLASLAGLALFQPVQAQTDAHPDVSITEAWMRVLTPEVPAGGYFTLENQGRSSLILTGASSPGCGMLMLHKSSDSGGMASMQEVRSLTVRPGGTLSFSPGGYHLMCMQPSASMRPGGMVPVDLQFADGKSFRTQFAVRGAKGQ